MGHSRTAIPQKAEIVGFGPVNRRMTVEKDAMADDGPRLQNAQIIEPLKRCKPMTARDLVELHHRLRGMDLKLDAARLGLIKTVADQVCRTGVYLRRRNHSRETPRGMHVG